MGDQVTRRTVRGTVRDMSGKPVEGASIVAVGTLEFRRASERLVFHASAGKRQQTLAQASSDRDGKFVLDLALDRGGAQRRCDRAVDRYGADRAKLQRTATWLWRHVLRGPERSSGRADAVSQRPDRGPSPFTDRQTGQRRVGGLDHAGAWRRPRWVRRERTRDWRGPSRQDFLLAGASGDRWRGAIPARRSLREGSGSDHLRSRCLYPRANWSSARNRSSAVIARHGAPSLSCLGSRTSSRPPGRSRAVVSDKDTGRPLAGIRVEIGATAAEPGLPFHFPATTDAQGRYRITGIAWNHARGLHAQLLPDAASGYFPAQHQHEEWPAGAAELRWNLTLKKGALVRGRVIDADSKQPIAARGYPARQSTRRSSPTRGGVSHSASTRDIVRCSSRDRRLITGA